MKKIQPPRKKYALAAIGATFLATFCHATLLAEWDIENVIWNEANAINVANNLEATPLSATGVTPLSQNYASYYPGSFAAKGWTIEANDLSQENYYSFSITPSVTATIEGISLSLTHGEFGGLGACEWVLCSSADAFTSTLATFTLSEDAIDVQTLFETTFDSALVVNGDTELEFRLYGYYPASSTDYSGLSNMAAGNYSGDEITGTGSNLKIYGTIPEPMALGLCSSVGIGFLFARRRFSA